MVTKRAGEGTLGVLKACLASKTVKRVVYISSASTILFNENKNVDVVDEAVWSDLEFCRSNNLISSSYLVSKILAERTVLEFGKENGLKVVSLVLPLVVGPFNCPKLLICIYSTRHDLRYVYVSLILLTLAFPIKKLVIKVEDLSKKSRRKHGFPVSRE